MAASYSASLFKLLRPLLRDPFRCRTSGATRTAVRACSLPAPEGGSLPHRAEGTGAVTGALTEAVTGALTGAVTGALTGTVAGALTGAVTGALTGDVTRALTGALTGTVTGDVTRALTGDVDRFGGVTVQLSDADLPADISESVFSDLLRDALVQWRAEGKMAVWLRVPISLSRCAAAASTHGFTFHHARHDHAVLSLWLGEAQSRLPGFATHQVGVAGAVVDESNGKVIVVQDRNKINNAWKFPGGLSDPGENIGATAVREVFEETGVRSEFRSLLSLRQQHNQPGAFGMSDMYLICRLSPLTYHINFCTQECLRCEWLDLAELARTSETTPITARVARLLLHGLERGFDSIDLGLEELPSVYTGMVYQLYHRPIPQTLKS